jgi:hypothetical protein
MLNIVEIGFIHTYSLAASFSQLCGYEVEVIIY